MNEFADNGDVAFLLGAGRSGTTLLYKLLSLHPGVAYISNYENRLGWLPLGWLLRGIDAHPELKLAAWFNHGNAYFVRRPVTQKLVPTPVEGESVYAACGIPLQTSDDFVPSTDSADRLRRRFGKIRADFGARMLLSKRTANNRRVPVLDRIFPAARYIHLVRDGREVANSLAKVEWWPNHVLFWDGRRAIDMEQAGHQRLELCARNWVNELAALENGLARIDSARIHELRYEELLQDPVQQLASLLAFLGVQMTREYADAVRSLQLSYRPFDWQNVWTKDESDRVMNEERATLQRLRYVD